MLRFTQHVFTVDALPAENAEPFEWYADGARVSWLRWATPWPVPASERVVAAFCCAREASCGVLQSFSFDTGAYVVAPAPIDRPTTWVVITSTLEGP